MGGFPDDTGKVARRRAATALTRAAVIEMLVGALSYLASNASPTWRLYGAIAIEAGGLVVLVMAIRAYRSSR